MSLVLNDILNRDGRFSISIRTSVFFDLRSMTHVNREIALN